MKDTFRDHSPRHWEMNVVDETGTIVAYAFSPQGDGLHWKLRNLRNSETHQFLTKGQAEKLLREIMDQ